MWFTWPNSFFKGAEYPRSRNNKSLTSLSRQPSLGYIPLEKQLRWLTVKRLPEMAFNAVISLVRLYCPSIFIILVKLAHRTAFPILRRVHELWLLIQRTLRALPHGSYKATAGVALLQDDYYRWIAIQDRIRLSSDCRVLNYCNLCNQWRSTERRCTYVPRTVCV